MPALQVELLLIQDIIKYNIFLIFRAFIREQALMLAEGLSDAIDFASNMNAVTLSAIVHENIPEDIAGFKKYFKLSCRKELNCDVFYDRSKSFYEAQGMRWGSFMGIFSSKTRTAYKRASEKGITGSHSGEGRLLGGLMVVRNGKVWYEYKEENYGDLVVVERVSEAIYESFGETQNEGNPIYASVGETRNEDNKA